MAEHLLEDGPPQWQAASLQGAGSIQLEPIGIGEGLLLRFLQFKAMMYKTLIMVFKREWISTLLRLFVPCVLIMVVFIGVIIAPSFSSVEHPPTSLLGNIPKCTTTRDDGKCVSLMYNINGNPYLTNWPQCFDDDGCTYEESKLAAQSPSHLSAANDTVHDYVQTVARGLDTRGARAAHSSKAHTAEQNFQAMVDNALREEQASRRAAQPTPREFADSIMQILCESNPDDKIEFGVDVVFTNMSDNVLRQYLFDEGNYTLGVVEFLPTQSLNGTVDFNYRIMYNGSYNYHFKMTGQEEFYFLNNIRYEIEAALERSFWLYYNENSTVLDAPEFTVNFKSLPKPTPANAETLIWTLAASVILVAIGVNYFYTQTHLSADKETGRRGQLKLAGLRDSVYWVTAILQQTTFSFCAVVMLVLLGWVMPKFVVFHDSALLALFLIFFSFEVLFNAIAAFTTVIFAKRKTAIVVASLHFGLFLVMVFSVSLWGVYVFDFFNGRLFGLNLGNLLMMFVPPFAYGVTMTELIINTVASSSNQNECFGDNYTVEGFTLEMFFGDPIPNVPFSSSCSIDVMPPYLLVMWLLFVSVALYLFTYWLDKVRSDDHKANLSPIYCCLPSYYSSGFGDRVDTGAALTIEHLTKTYKKGFFASEGITAIRPFQMQVPSDSIFCLLGPNGAGKTTIIGCLTGLVEPSEGDARLFGYSIRNSMDAIRSMMGVCPQFDMLFDNLTAWEHMRITNWMKRPQDQMSNEELAERLDDVKLTKVAHQMTKTYSGGMKRRLSVVLSTVGNPRVIFMDEPSTGMDPGNRRYVWDLVRKIKDGKLIVLTTHSMEEADMLGDQIAIVAAGKLRCAGTPTQLKSRFGLGYRVTLSCAPENTEAAKKLVRRHLPGAQLRGDNAGALVYSLPDVDLDDSVAQFFEALQNITTEEGSKLIEDWGCQNTTMEDVFLTVTRKIMGQDITFDNDSKRSQLDRDEREIFRSSAQRFEMRIRHLNEEVQQLRDLLEKHGIDSSSVTCAIDREELELLED